MSLQLQSQLNKKKLIQIQDQEFSNSSLCTVLSTIEEIFLKECELQKIKPTVHRTFQYYDCFKAGSTKSLPQLYDQCRIQLKTYCQSHQIYFEDYGEYHYPSNLSQEDIMLLMKAFWQIDEMRPYLLNLNFILNNEYEKVGKIDHKVCKTHKVYKTHEPMTFKAVAKILPQVLSTMHEKNQEISKRFGDSSDHKIKAELKGNYHDNPVTQKEIIYEELEFQRIEKRVNPDSSIFDSLFGTSKTSNCDNENKKFADDTDKPKIPPKEQSEKDLSQVKDDCLLMYSSYQKDTNLPIKSHAKYFSISPLDHLTKSFEGVSFELDRINSQSEQTHQNQKDFSQKMKKTTLDDRTQYNPEISEKNNISLEKHNKLDRIISKDSIVTSSFNHKTNLRDKSSFKKWGVSENLPTIRPISTSIRKFKISIPKSKLHVQKKSIAKFPKQKLINGNKPVWK